MKRFMRYVLPGLASTIQLAIALIISDYNVIIENSYCSLGNPDNIGLILGIFLASGGIGYIFANIYFAIYWCCPNCCFAIDYRSVFINLKQNLRIFTLSENQIAVNTLTKKDAWSLVNYYWYTSIEKSEKLKGIDPKMERFTDLIQSIWATLIGSFLSLITWICLHFSIFEDPAKYHCKNFFIFFVWILILKIFCMNHFRTQKALQNIVKSTLMNIIKKEYDKNKTKIKIYYEIDRYKINFQQRWEK